MAYRIEFVAKFTSNTIAPNQIFYPPMQERQILEIELASLQAATSEICLNELMD